MSNRASGVLRHRRPKRYLGHSQEVTGTLRNDFRLIDSVTIRPRPHLDLNRLRKTRCSDGFGTVVVTLAANRPPRAGYQRIPEAGWPVRSMVMRRLSPRGRDTGNPSGPSAR